MGQQLKAVDDVLIKCGLLRQQDDGFGAGALPEGTVAVGVIGTVGAQDAQVVPVHPAQVSQRHPGVHGRADAHALPEALHIGIIGEAGAVHRVVKGVVNGSAANGVGQGVFVALPGVLPGRCSLPDVLRQGHLRTGGGLGEAARGAQAVLPGIKGHLLQLVGRGEQDAAQHAAAVGEADDAVLLIGADGAAPHQPYPGQPVQLIQSRGAPLLPGHLLVFFAAGEGRDSGVRLLHLGGIGGSEGGLCLSLYLVCPLGCPRGRGQNGRQHQCQCADRAQKSMALFLHI